MNEETPHEGAQEHVIETEEELLSMIEGGEGLDLSAINEMEETLRLAHGDSSASEAGDADEECEGCISRDPPREKEKVNMSQRFMEWLRTGFKLAQEEDGQEEKKKAAGPLLEPPESPPGASGGAQTNSLSFSDVNEEPAYKTPLVFSEVEEFTGEGNGVGGKLYRKQLLPFGRKINYKGRVIEFTRSMGERMASNFKDRAVDIVPFIFAGDKNEHTESPKYYAGEVKDVLVSDQGVDIVTTLSGEAERIVASSPNFGVSATLHPDFTRPDDKKRFGPTIFNALGTFRAHISGMSPWQTYEMSGSEVPEGAYAFSSSSGEVIDLTEAEWSPPETGKDGDPAMENQPGNTPGQEGTEEVTTTMELTDDLKAYIDSLVSAKDEQIEGLTEQLTTLSQENQVNTKARREQEIDLRMEREFKSVPPYIKKDYRELLLSDVAQAPAEIVQFSQDESGNATKTVKQGVMADKYWEMLTKLSQTPAISASLGEQGSEDVDPEYDVSDDDGLDRRAHVLMSGDKDLTYEDAIMLAAEEADKGLARGEVS